MGCCKNCKREFQCANFGLGYSKPDDFVVSRWRCCSGLLYVVYRVCAFLYFLGWLIYSGIDTKNDTDIESDRVLWFVYLTYWAFLVLNIHLLIQVILSLVAHVRKTRQNNEGPIFKDMTWYLKASWVISNISNCMAILVSIMYWSLLYKPGQWFAWLTFTTHASNAMFTIIDIVIRTAPLRLFHVWHPMLFTLSYMIFSCIFIRTGGYNIKRKPYIYPQLDWNNKLSFSAIMTTITVLIVVPLLWLPLYFLFRISLCVSGAIFRKEPPKEEAEEDHENGGIDDETFNVSL